MLNSLIGKVSLGLLGGRAHPALGAVQTLAITGASGGEVADLTPTLTWDAPEDDGLGAPDSYTIRYADNELFNDSTTVTGVAVTNYTLTTQPNATYIYAQVWAIRWGITGATATAVSALMLVAVSRDDYPGDVAAPLAGSRTPQVGSAYTITDSGSILSIVDGVLTPSGTATGSNDPKLTGTHTRAAGLTLSLKLKVAAGASPAGADIGWQNSTNVWGIRHNGAGVAYSVRVGGNTLALIQAAAAADVYDLIDVVLYDSTGYAVYLNKRLVYITERATNASVDALLTMLSAGKQIPYVERRLIYTNDAPLATMAGTALVNANPPTSDVEYTTQGNVIARCMFTAEAGSLTSERGITFRKSVTQAGVNPDYWRVYFDTSGHLQIQQYIAGVGQGATQIGTSLLAAGASLGITVVADGSYIQVYTYTTAYLPTIRGSVQSDGVLNDNAIVVFDAGDGTLGQAWVHPIEAPEYSRLNPGFEPIATYSDDDLGDMEQVLDAGNTLTLLADTTYTFTEFQALALSGRSNIHITSNTTDPAHYPVVYKSGYDDNNTSYLPGRNTFTFTNCPNLEIDHIKFTGNHLLANGWTNGQAGAISLSGAGNTNAHLHHLVFEDLPGFVINGLGHSSGVTVHDVYYYNCGNGINIASPNGKFYNIIFDHAEGLEVGGDNMEVGGSAGAIVATNVYITAGSFGGNQTPGQVDEGMRVSNFTATNLLEGNVMFIVADNIDDIVLTGLVASGAPFGYSAQSPSASRPITNALFDSCVADDCEQAYYMPLSSGALGVEMDGCVSTNATQYGLNCANPNLNVHGCSFTDSATKDVRLAASSAGMTFAGDNTYVTIEDLR